MDNQAGAVAAPDNVSTKASKGVAEPRRASFADAFREPYFLMTVTTMVGVVITALDNYIVNTAMPVILRDLHDPAFYAWVTSAFILAQVIGLSLGGAWRDRAGLRTPFVTSVVTFGLGSLACGFAPNMALLVVARGIQGLGGGGLSAISFAASASYPEGLRIRMFSLTSTVWGVVSLMGPLAGGLITDHIGWRWIFLLNVPICVVVALVGLRGYPSTPPEGPRHALPIFRAGLLAVAAASLVGAPSASREFAIPLLVIGIAMAWLYLRQERRAKVHIIPLSTWLRRDAVGSCMQATLFFTGSYMGASVFLPLYLQGVRGLTATQASLAVTAPGVCWTLGAIAASQATGPWPRWVVRGGAFFVSAGGLGIAIQIVAGHALIPLVVLCWMFAAFGIGMAMLHLMNWAVAFSPSSQTGAISGAVQACRMLGSASGGALMGALLLAVGPDPQHLPRAITAIFLLVAVLALWPATFGMPKTFRPESEPGVAVPAEVVA